MNTLPTCIACVFIAATLSASPAVAGTAQPGVWVRWNRADGGNGHLYKAVLNPDNLDWTEVSQIARTEGGYLATINSAAENDFVFSLINSPEFFQGVGGNGSGPAIGGFQPDDAPQPDGGWRWITGERWDFTSWAPGQPDTAAENRLEYWSGTQGVPAATWNDLTADDRNLGGYIIEKDEDLKPGRTGFYGQAFVGDRTFGFPTVTMVSVYGSDGHVEKRVVSNPAGQFYTFIKPGAYTLVGSRDGQRAPFPELGKVTLENYVTTNIIVAPNVLTPVDFNY